MGPVPDTDDFADPITDTFIDGKTDQGPWAKMTPASYQKYGLFPGEFGNGIAQQYEKQGENWIKTKG